MNEEQDCGLFLSIRYRPADDTGSVYFLCCAPEDGENPKKKFMGFSFQDLSNLISIPSFCCYY